MRMGSRHALRHDVWEEEARMLSDSDEHRYLNDPLVYALARQLAYGFLEGVYREEDVQCALRCAGRIENKLAILHREEERNWGEFLTRKND